MRARCLRVLVYQFPSIVRLGGLTRLPVVYLVPREWLRAHQKTGEIPFLLVHQIHQWLQQCCAVILRGHLAAPLIEYIRKSTVQLLDHLWSQLDSTEGRSANSDQSVR